MTYQPLFSNHTDTEIVQLEAPLAIIDAILNPYSAYESDYVEAKLWVTGIESKLRQSYPNVSYITTSKSPQQHSNPFYGYIDFTVNFGIKSSFTSEEIQSVINEAKTYSSTSTSEVATSTDDNHSQSSEPSEAPKSWFISMFDLTICHLR